MFGFTFLHHNKPSDFHLPQSKGILRGSNYTAFNHMIDKFENDKLFYETADYLVILDGVVLNKEELTCASKLNWSDTLLQLFLANNQTFAEQLRGSFAGIIYDKKKDTTIVFTDHVGSKFVYYSLGTDYFIISSYISNIYSYFQYEDISYSLSTENAYLLLTYGFMLEDRTLCDKIQKLEPGRSLIFEHDGGLKAYEYCTISNEPDYRLSDKDAVELLDEQFCKAISLQFKKDDEYGYRHFVGLSGGLDSRMTSLVAHKLGYTEQLNFTFSQSNYWDEKIAKDIATSYKHEWIFMALDNGCWLLSPETINRSTGGNVIYSGSAHSHSLYRNIDFSNLGIIHTGLLSGAFMGRVYAPAAGNAKFKLGDWAFSTKLIHRLDGIDLKTLFDNQEIGNIYYRGLCGIQNGMVDSMNYSENMSPTQHVDFIKNALLIPNTQKNALYFKWILEKHPEAVEFGWEKIGGAKITSPHIRVANRIVPIQHIPQKTFKILARKIGLSWIYQSKDNMNPIGYYLKHNTDLQLMVKKYSEYIDLISDEILRNDVRMMLSSAKGNEVIMAVTLLSAIALYRLK